MKKKQHYNGSLALIVDRETAACLAAIHRSILYRLRQNKKVGKNSDVMSALDAIPADRSPEEHCQGLAWVDNKPILPGFNLPHYQERSQYQKRLKDSPEYGLLVGLEESTTNNCHMYPDHNYVIPGGKKRHQEQPLDTARREFKEETLIDIETWLCKKGFNFNGLPTHYDVPPHPESPRPIPMRVFLVKLPNIRLLNIDIQDDHAKISRAERSQFYRQPRLVHNQEHQVKDETCLSQSRSSEGSHSCPSYIC